jgi:hypothetical protein
MASWTLLRVFMRGYEYSSNPPSRDLALFKHHVDKVASSLTKRRKTPMVTDGSGMLRRIAPSRL